MRWDRCSSPRRARQAEHSQGFSLVELLVVLALLSVIVGIGLPAMLNSLNRSRLAAFAQQTASAMQAARLEAIKRSTVTRVEIHFSANSNSVIAYVDTNKNNVYDPPNPSTPTANDILIFQVTAPAGVVYQGPGTTANSNAVYGFDTISGGGVVLFNSDGSVSKQGGFRIRDQRANIMEVFVSPQASARIAVRKYAGNPNGGDDPTLYFESDESPGWTWN